MRPNRKKHMKYLPKIFLTVAIVTFAIGASELGDNIFFYMGRPVGAIFFVLFMIFQFLQKETALYNEQHEMQPAPVKAATARPSALQPRRPKQIAAGLPA